MTDPDSGDLAWLGITRAGARSAIDRVKMWTLIPRVSPLGWWDFGAEADRVREGLGVSLRVLGWAIA